MHALGCLVFQFEMDKPFPFWVIQLECKMRFVLCSAIAIHSSLRRLVFSPRTPKVFKATENRCVIGKSPRALLLSLNSSKCGVIVNPDYHEHPQSMQFFERLTCISSPCTMILSTCSSSIV